MKSTTLSNGSTTAEEMDNSRYSNELIQKEQIPKSPFMGIKYEDEPWFIVLGKYKVAEGFQDMQAMQAYLEDNKWQCIALLMQLIIEEDKQQTQFK